MTTEAPVQEQPQIAAWSVRDLIPYDKNSKIHTDAQIKALAKLIKDNGWTSPIVVDKSGVIIAGHGRRLAAISLGLEKVPVIVRADLTSEQVRALRLADNKVAEATGHDTELMQQEIAELADLDIDLLDFGFSDKELSFLTADLGEMNEDAFVDDLEVEVAAHDASTEKTIENVSGREVPISKILGFSKVPAEHERKIRQFMMELEHESGKEGVDAFTHFVNNLMETEEDAA